MGNKIAPPTSSEQSSLGTVSDQKGRHVHRRSVITDCWMTDDGRFTAVGTLIDDKGVPSLTYSGKIVPIGNTMHDMQVTIELSRKLEIEKINASMRGVPGDTCREIESNYSQLIGLSIARGFTRQVMERVSGIGGCSHVTTLILQMAPAIMQAYMSAEALKGFEPKRWAGLTGTCHIFRENGPGFARLDEFARMEWPLKQTDSATPDKKE